MNISKSNKKVAFAVIAALIIASASFYMLFVDKDTPQEILSGFYDAVYVQSDLNGMKECMGKSYRYFFEQAVTMAGMKPDYYTSYREEAVRFFGESFNTEVKITDQKPITGHELELLKKKDKSVSEAGMFTYDIIFSNDEEQKVYSNTLSMIKIRGRWYMTTHLTLPIGTNIYAY